MSIEIILGIIGAVFTIGFGIVGVYLTIKSKYPGAITFVNEQTIELFDAVGSSVDHLEVTYKGGQINENLVLLNGAFINSGKTDIAPNMVETPISLKLPDGFKWLTGKVVGSKMESKLSQVDDNTIQISTGLFRCGECVRFNALAQLPEDESYESNAKKLHKSISFEHRITNTQKIDETEVKPLSASKKELIQNSSSIVIIVFGLLLSIGIDMYRGVNKNIVFPYTVKDGVTEKVSARIKSDDTVQVTSTDSKYEASESLKSLYQGLVANHP